MNLNCLKVKQKCSLLELLQIYVKMIDRTLGKYTAFNYTITSKEDSKPYHKKPFSIPIIQESILKKEVDRLINIKVLKKINNSRQAAPTFIIPKINGTVRVVSDFREINKTIKRKCFKIFKIYYLNQNDFGMPHPQI